jgi:hypothetical protein
VKNYLLRLIGATPLVMHSDRLADPLDDYTKAVKEISGKTTKTEADHLELGKREFVGGLYYNPEVGVYIPAENIHKCLIESARRQKLGKHVERGVLVDVQHVPLQYDGPQTPEALWDNPAHRYRKSVGVGKKRIMRTRPMFPAWELEIPLVVDETVLDGHVLAQIVEEAGRYVGLCERRPMFGKFDAELIEA